MPSPILGVSIVPTLAAPAINGLRKKMQSFYRVAALQGAIR